MNAYRLCLPILMLLAGCQSLGWSTPAIRAAGATEQCIAPQPLPQLDDSASARLAWLDLHLELATLPPMLAWRAQQNYTSTDLTRTQLVAALVTSRPDSVEPLRRLGQHTLAQFQPRLPATVQPIFNLAQQYNAAVLSLNEQGRRRAAAEARALGLEAELAEKQRQLEALTAIESQLRDDSLDRPSNPSNPGGNDAL